MVMSNPAARIVSGVILALLGLLWTAQGLDLLGQEGGMNGRAEWVVIGIIAVVVGVVLAVSGVRARSRL